LRNASKPRRYLNVKLSDRARRANPRRCSLLIRNGGPASGKPRPPAWLLDPGSPAVSDGERVTALAGDRQIATTEEPKTAIARVVESSRRQGETACWREVDREERPDFDPRAGTGIVLTCARSLRALTRARRR
jgi:hypothetical protein